MIGNIPQRPSHHALMTQSALITPVYVSNRRLENMNCIYEPTEKIGGLFLGDVISTLKSDLLQQHRIRAVLTCMNDRVSLPVMLAHKILPIQDTLQYPIYHFFDEASEWIDSRRKEGLNVLVHCHAGVSRSATIVISYLMRFKGWTALEALSYVRMRRERAKPNASFWNQLIQYQNRLLQKTLPSQTSQNSKSSQNGLITLGPKEYPQTTMRHSEDPQAQNSYEIRILTPKRQEVTPARISQGPREEPKSNPHPKRKRIFDQEHNIAQNHSEARRHEVLSHEPHSVVNTDHKKFSHSIIFPNQRQAFSNPQHHLSQDPFRQTKSALEYRLDSCPQSPLTQQSGIASTSKSGLHYVSPFELPGYRKAP